MGKNRENNKNNSELNASKITRNTVFLCLVVVAIIAVLLTTVITERANRAIRDSSARFIEANSSQLQMNINSYFDKVESTAALMFSDEKYYKYDATDESLDEYDKITAEEDIVDKIIDLGLMENFSDFTIIYSDNSHIGWFSNTSKDLFGKEIYSIIEPQIKNEKTNDGWFSGYEDYYDRMYYVKRLNPNAILLVSFYSRELESAFDIPGELSGMYIRLVDENEYVLYSSNRQEIGMPLSDEISKKVEGLENASYVDEFTLLNSSSCDNGWNIICEMSMETVLADVQNLRGFTYGFAALIIVVFGIAIIMGLRRVNHPLDSTINSLSERAETDGLSGLYNKITFESKVSDVLTGRNNVAFVMIDMDKFKNVNDTKGHAYGDEVIVRMSKVLKTSLREDTIIGRLGGDEFAFMFSDNDYAIDVLKEKVIARLADINKVFDEEFIKDKAELGISLSFGAYVAPYDDESFSEIYALADRALYMSKEAGRDRYTILDNSGKGDK